MLVAAPTTKGDASFRSGRGLPIPEGQVPPLTPGGGARMRRLLAAVIAIGAFATAAFVGAAPATSDPAIPFQARIGSIFGMIPPASVSNNGAISNSAPASGSLYYNGGPVMTTNKVYAIYWQPSGYQLPSGYAKNMDGYFKDLQATNGKNTNTYDNMTQYTQQ